MNAKATEQRAGAFMRTSVCGWQALLFLHDSSDRTALLKRIAARGLDWVNETRAQPGLGAPALLLRISLPQQKGESLLLNNTYFTLFRSAAEQGTRPNQFLEFPFTNRPSLVLRYFSMVSMLLVWVLRACPNSRIMR